MTGTSKRTLNPAWEEFGNMLKDFREKRLDVSLRELEQCERNQGKEPFTKSTLHRCETGRLLPRLRYAGQLDELYQAGGWIRTEVANLRDAGWDPARDNDGVPKNLDLNRWPKNYSGLVWVHVKPTAQLIGAEHYFGLRWGPWMTSLRTIVPGGGVYLYSGKAKSINKVSTAMEVACDKPVFMLFGAGDPKSKMRFGDIDVAVEVIDLREEWELRHPDR